MSQWHWQSACLEGTKQTRSNSRESQTDGIYRNHLRAEEPVPPAPRGRRCDLRWERREEKKKSTEARGVCMNKRDAKRSRDVTASREVRDGGSQLASLLSGPAEQSVWKWGTSTREQAWTGGGEGSGVERGEGAFARTKGEAMASGGEASDLAGFSGQRHRAGKTGHGAGGGRKENVEVWLE